MPLIHALLLSIAVPLGPAPVKKLIEWGGDSPNTKQFREQIEVMEKSSFDGTVVNAVGKDNADIAWMFLSPKVFTKEQFAENVADLKATKRTRFTDNFLRLNVTPGGIDFFDDAGWSAVVSHAKIAAWIAKQGGLKGFMFDTEMYEKMQFKYSDQKDAKSRSFEEYAAAARRRGNDVIRAMNSEYPDVTILFTFAYGLTAGSRTKLPTAMYGLLPLFIDGMLEASTDKTSFVDANEYAYPAKQRKDFEFLFVHVHVGSKQASLIPDIYEKKMSVGFGVWIDNDWRTKGWDPKAPEKNYFSPDELRTSLGYALSLSNRYVWLYSEKINWWTGAGLSEPYIKAVADARASVATQTAPSN